MEFQIKSPGTKINLNEIVFGFKLVAFFGEALQFISKIAIVIAQILYPDL